MKEETGYEGEIVNISKETPSTPGLTTEEVYFAFVKVTKKGEQQLEPSEIITVEKVNITKPVFIGEELVMTLKPMKAAVYQEATGNYTRKIYLDETTKLPILILFEAPNPSSLPVSISVSLAETNICQLQ